MKNNKIMQNYTNISISAEDNKNPRLLVIINKFSDNSVFLKIFNLTENRLEIIEYIEHKHILNIIDAFLAEAKIHKYNLKDSDYSQLFPDFVKIIFNYIMAYYFNGYFNYNEIKLINLKEY